MTGETQTDSAAGMTAKYAAAQNVMDGRLARLVAAAIPAVHWIKDTDRAWFVTRDANGVRLMVADANTGTVSVLADDAALRGALKPILDDEKAPLPDVLSVSTDNVVVFGRGGKPVATCRLPDGACTPVAEASSPLGLLSPDGKHRLIARDDDLWVIDVASGEERRLTHDGTPTNSYGKLPDRGLLTVPRMRGTLKLPPIGVIWSPDGRSLFGTRLNESEIPPGPFVEWVPMDGTFRPKVYPLRVPLLGEAEVGHAEVFVIDVATGRKITVSTSRDFPVSAAPEGWSADSRKLYTFVRDLGARRARLLEIDLDAGAARTVLEENVDTNFDTNSYLYNGANIRVIGGGKELVWFSQRSGWGHLYLYDIQSGRLLRQLTSGDWLVRDIVGIDETRRVLFFTATGREAGRDPYYRAVYRVSLDGGDVTLLTPEDGDHAVDGPINPATALALGRQSKDSPLSPDHRFLIGSYSRVDMPPVTLMRDAKDGRVIATLYRFDDSALRDAGWRPPERVIVRAADGKTDLVAVIYRPPGFDPKKTYPVIDAAYGGPQITNVPPGFIDAVTTMNPVGRSSLAQLGFIVVTIDGRGTPGRSKAFHNVGYGDFAGPQIEDHVAAIQQMAARFPGFDLDRVGIYGHSFGGYFSARAMFLKPDFYKAAVSSAGAHHYGSIYSGLEAVVGLPDYGNGRRDRPADGVDAANFAAVDNPPLAGNLRGKLLLVYGDMDENAPPVQTIRLVDALIKANRRFDLLYLPNQAHGFFRTDGYYMQRMWDYFVEHLLHEEPPQDFTVTYDAGAQGAGQGF